MTEPDRQDEDGLLPCPFCGGAPILDKHAPTPGEDDSFFVIRCASCGFSKEYNYRSNVNRWWNTRAQSRGAAEGAEDAEWCRQAKKTLEHLGGFLQKMGAPHRVDWREWIDSADKHLGLKWPNDAQAAAPPKPAPSPFVQKLNEIVADANAGVVSKPAPDAMREWLRKRIGGYLDAVRLGATNEGVTNTLIREFDSLSAPVPPADGAAE